MRYVKRVVLLPQRIAHFLRVKFTGCAPDFLSLRIEENESGRIFKAIYRGKFFADFLLNV